MASGTVSRRPRSQMCIRDSYYSCEWQIRACHMCTTALCQTSCPHAAIVTLEDGTRTVDPEKCVGCGTCVAACPWHMPVVNTETHKSTKCVACGRCAEQCPNGALELIKWENVNHSSGPTRSEKMCIRDRHWLEGICLTG